MAQGKYQNPRRRKRRSNGSGILIILGILIIVMVVLALLHACQRNDEPPSSTNDTAAATTTEAPVETTTETTGPTEPYVVSTASVGVTGDILMHMPVVNSAAIGNGSYDFSDNYIYIKEYYESFDFMIANLEVTLGGEEAGPYQGYPTFNCPDDIVDSLLGAGVDMLLTANNHSYDNGYNGMMRTQKVLDEKGMPHLGTRQTTDEKHYIVQDINGVKVGMVCYTYETGDTSDGRKTLNGIALSSDACPLVSSFDYNDMQTFYNDVADTLAAMEAEGADATMLFIHWGNEYQLSPSQTQQNIAQELCELGVDVIVGGHPHVVQPFETLTASTGDKTYCMYSTGNAISNQRRHLISSAPSGHTEDGMVFGVTFEKWNDGSVNICGISILPTWVNLEWKNDKNTYNIIPLDSAIPVWDCYDMGNVSYAYNSYKRTMAIVGEGLNTCLEALALPTMPITFGEE